MRGSRGDASMTDERVDDELEGDPARPPWTFFGETFPRWLLRRRQEEAKRDYGCGGPRRGSRPPARGGGREEATEGEEPAR